MQNIFLSNIKRYKVFQELKKTNSFGNKYKKAKLFFTGFFVSFIFIDKYCLDRRAYDNFYPIFFRDISSELIKKKNNEDFEYKSSVRYLYELDKKKDLTYLEFFKKLDEYCFLLF